MTWNLIFEPYADRSFHPLDHMIGGSQVGLSKLPPAISHRGSRPWLYVLLLMPRYGSRSFKSTKELFPLSLSRSVFRILCSYCMHVFVIYWGGFTKSWVLWVAHSDSQWVREVKLYSGSHVFVLNSWVLTHLSFMKYAVFLFWATGESGISNLKAKWWISRYMCDY